MAINDQHAANVARARSRLDPSNLAQMLEDALASGTVRAPEELVAGDVAMKAAASGMYPNKNAGMDPIAASAAFRPRPRMGQRSPEIDEAYKRDFPVGVKERAFGRAGVGVANRPPIRVGGGMSFTPPGQEDQLTSSSYEDAGLKVPYDVTEREDRNTAAEYEADATYEGMMDPLRANLPGPSQMLRKRNVETEGIDHAAMSPEEHQDFQQGLAKRLGMSQPTAPELGARGLGDKAAYFADRAGPEGGIGAMGGTGKLNYIPTVASDNWSKSADADGDGFNATGAPVMQTQAGRDAMRYAAKQGDTKYQQAIAAAKANNAKPVEDQESLPVMMRDARRQPFQQTPQQTADMIARRGERKERDDAAREMIKERGMANAANRDVRMGQPPMDYVPLGVRKQMDLTRDVAGAGREQEQLKQLEKNGMDAFDSVMKATGNQEQAMKARNDVIQAGRASIGKLSGAFPNADPNADIKSAAESVIQRTGGAQTKEAFLDWITKFPIEEVKANPKKYLEAGQNLFGRGVQDFLQQQTKNWFTPDETHNEYSQALGGTGSISHLGMLGKNLKTIFDPSVQGYQFDPGMKVR